MIVHGQQKVFFRGRNVVAMGSIHMLKAPQVGQLVVIGATATSPGYPRRIASVANGERDGRPYWAIEHTDPEAEATTGARTSIGYWKDRGWSHLPEHHPICGACRKLLPCEHVVIETIAAASTKTMNRFSTPGVCPQCQEPVTTRQASHTFDKNLHGLAAVTFHLRQSCRSAAYDYDQRLHADDGKNELTCPGSSWIRYTEDRHRIFYCSEEACRGVDRRHLNDLGAFATGTIPEGYTKVETP